MSLLTPSENGTAASDETAPQPMRRMRKGTRSCTECRRRKVRCIFHPGNPAVCSRCSSRGLRCIDQRLVGVDSAEDEKKTLRDRIARLEALVEAGIDGPARDACKKRQERRFSNDEESVNGDLSGNDYALDLEPPLMAVLDQTMKAFNINEADITTPQFGHENGNITAKDRMQSSQTQDPEEIPPTRHLKICTRLLALLPPYEELHRELAASGFWWKSWREKTFGPAKGAVSLAEFASETYFSGNFLQIALLVLAYARTVEIDASRYLKAVDRLIISRDEYASGLEGLECIILQAKCHLDFGQPRRAWLTYRRGIMLAQLTNFHSTHALSPERAAIWWSLYHGDRFCSLLLGLPHCTHDPPLAAVYPSLPSSAEAPTTTHQLMRRSGEIAGAVILLHQSKAVPQLSSILVLDEQLDELAASMPQSWWDPQLPSPCPEGAESELRSRLLLHAYFLHVRMYLHLPLLLGPVSSDQATLSRKRCLEAARMLLQRCTLLRSTLKTCAVISKDRSFDCKTNDFVGFTAAIVLLIGLLNGNQSDHINRVQDWERLQKARHFFKSLQASKDCKMAMQCFKALDALMKMVDGSDPQTNEAPTQVFIPHFGKVGIRRKAPATSSPATTYANSSRITASELQHSQPAHLAAQSPSDLDFGAGLGYPPEFESSQDFEGIEAFLQEPGIMFSPGEPTLYNSGSDANMDLLWWDGQLMDIDGDWEMLYGTSGG